VTRDWNEIVLGQQNMQNKNIKKSFCSTWWNQQNHVRHVKCKAWTDLIRGYSPFHLEPWGLIHQPMLLTNKWN
jgi:hypothetical protein